MTRATIAALVVLTAWVTAATGQVPPCNGDFNGDEGVTVDEIVVSVNNALGGCQSQCLGDFNGDGAVTVEEIVVAVNNALNGCPTGPVAGRTLTPTPTPRRPTRTLTRTPTVTPTRTSRPTRPPTYTRTPTATPTRLPWPGAMNDLIGKWKLTSRIEIFPVVGTYEIKTVVDSMFYGTNLITGGSISGGWSRYFYPEPYRTLREFLFIENTNNVCAEFNFDLDDRDHMSGFVAIRPRSVIGGCSDGYLKGGSFDAVRIQP